MTSEGDDPYGFWPTASQELLLRAALLDGERARAAFEAWESRTVFRELDGGSVLLLPLLYQNLVDQGIGEGSLLCGRLRGIVRQSWYKNQMLLGALSEVLERFAQAGIRTLLLKGVPLALCYYPKLALRPMTDADILIPGDCAAKALDIALGAGLTPRFQEGDWPPRFTASKAFAHPDGWEFDIHTKVMHECLALDADDELWASAVPLTVGSVSTLTLAPEDHMLHVLVHGFRRNPLPPVRWVADAAMVLRRERVTFDWLRLWHRARTRRLSLIVGKTLRYLKDRISIEVPDAGLSPFETTPIGLAERFHYRSRLISGGVGLTGLVSDYFRIRERDRDWQGPLGILHYLRDWWRLQSSWELPAAAGGRALRRVRESMRASSRR